MRAEKKDRGRLIHLDVLRVLAVALVMFGHFVSVGSGARTIPGVIRDTALLPLIDVSTHSLETFEIALINYCQTQSAILGVSIFFLVTGYLMPMMLDRYSRAEFLVNRVFRIFPVLVVAVLLVGIFVGITQAVHFSPISYFGSFTLLYPWLRVEPVMGVLWTLVVEVLFYLTAAAIGRFTYVKILAAQAVLLAILAASTLLPDWYNLFLAALQAKYMVMILVGSAIYLFPREPRLWLKLGMVVETVLASLGAFRIFAAGHQDVLNYKTIGNHLTAFVIFLLAFALARFLKAGLFTRVLAYFSDVVYPIYLVHVAFGLGTMGVLKGLGVTNAYLLIGGAVAASLIVATLLHRLVEEPGISLGRRVTGLLRARRGASAALGSPSREAVRPVARAGEA